MDQLTRAEKEKVGRWRKTGGQNPAEVTQPERGCYGTVGSSRCGLGGCSFWLLGEFVRENTAGFVKVEKQV